MSQALRIHATSVKRYIENYQNKGKLKAQNGGSVGCLSRNESEALAADLVENSCAFSRQIIADVTETFGKTFTVLGIHNWLHQHGFSYKKPKGTPHKFDFDKQTAFIEKYQNLKVEAEEA